MLEATYGRQRGLIGYDELMRRLEAQKVTIEAGDFLCLYTGFADLVLDMNKRPDGEVLARSCAVLDGRDSALLDWITQSGLVAICADNSAVEAYPARPTSGDSFPGLPLHNHCLFRQGIHLGELWYFAELAPRERAVALHADRATAASARRRRLSGAPIAAV